MATTIDTFYQLVERDTRRVSATWKVLQILGYAWAGVTGLAATITFYMLLNAFSMNCIFYSTIKFKPIFPDDERYKNMTNIPNATINTFTTSWHDDFICQYCMCTWMMSFVGGLILGSFFVLNPTGGKGYPHSLFSQPWKLISPTILVTLIMVILTAKAAVNASHGINSFCKEFYNYTGNFTCTQGIDIFSLKYHDAVQPVHTIIITVKSGAILTFIAWLYCMILLIMRVCLAPDFDLQVIVLNPKGQFQRRTVLSQPSHVGIPKRPIGHIENLSLEEVVNPEKKTDRPKPYNDDVTTDNTRISIMKTI